jgi:type III secretory pathway component EscS
MKINPKDIRKTTSKLAESFKKTHDKNWLRVIWSNHWEIIIAAIAGLIVSILFLMLR